MPIPQNQLEKIIGQTVVDSEGNKVGKASDVYLDQDTNEPEWLAVNTGFFGTNVSFVPLVNASFNGERVTVPFSSEQIKASPNADADGALSQDEEARLYSHYGMGYSTSSSGSGLPTGTTNASSQTSSSQTSSSQSSSAQKSSSDYDAEGTVGRNTSGPTTDQAMTRSEEEFDVNTESRQTGRARLRKYVVNEQQSVSVPVSREDVRIEREPITDANTDAAMSGPDIAEEEHEIVLSEEVPVVDTKTVPKERQVSADLRKEPTDIDDNVDADTNR